MSRSAQINAGFTLVEVLVSLTILSISLAALLQIFASTLDRTREAKVETEAASLAESLLEQAGIALPLRLGETGGEFSNGFRWRLLVAPYGNADDQKAWPVQAVQVSASVLWNTGRRPVSLTALRLIPKDQP